jgi:hypothetical protein
MWSVAASICGLGSAGVRGTLDALRFSDCADAAS